MTTSIRSSFAHFTVWFIVITVLFGLIAMIATKSGLSFLIPFFSMSIMLPYMISFYLMTKHFIKKHQNVPEKKQRWQLSLGCLGIFWSISILSGVIGMLLTGADFSQADQGTMVFFVLIFGGYLLFINILLLLLGFFFLGKPAAMMLSHLKR